MRRGTRLILLLGTMTLSCLAETGWCEGKGGDPESTLRQRAQEFVAAVQSKSPKRIRALFRSDGFTCTDSVIDIARIDRDLTDPSSYLSTYLFSARQFHEQYDKGHTRDSLSDVLEAPGAPAIRIEFPEVAGKEVTAVGCSWIQSADNSRQTEICWIRQGMEWKIDRGLYNCE